MNRGLVMNFRPNDGNKSSQGFPATRYVALPGAKLGGSTLLEPPVDGNEFTVEIGIVRSRAAEI